MYRSSELGTAVSIVVAAGLLATSPDAIKAQSEVIGTAVSAEAIRVCSKSGPMLEVFLVSEDGEFKPTQSSVRSLGKVRGLCGVEDPTKTTTLTVGTEAVVTSGKFAFNIYRGSDGSLGLGNGYSYKPGDEPVIGVVHTSDRTLQNVHFDPVKAVIAPTISPAYLGAVYDVAVAK